MKIQNETIKALLEQADAPQKTRNGQAGQANQTGQAGQAGFENLLAAQLQKAAAARNTAAGMEGVSGLPADQSAVSLALLMQSAPSAPGLMSEETAEAAQRIGGLLDQWEQYAQALGGPESDDLRGVFGMLQGMTQNVKELKSSMAGLLESDPTLAALVNELDVMTTTETIKFNRGDYL